jgi:hypothetical protein
LDLFPNDSIAQAQLQLVLAELDRFQEATALPSGQVEAAGAEGPLPPAQLMLRFEALGQNCEFGVVQRHYGAEPLGLLRFSSTPLHLLVAALNNDLAVLANRKIQRWVSRPGNTLRATTGTTC